MTPKEVCEMLKTKYDDVGMDDEDGGTTIIYFFADGLFSYNFNVSEDGNVCNRCTYDDEDDVGCGELTNLILNILKLEHL